MPISCQMHDTFRSQSGDSIGRYYTNTYCRKVVVLILSILGIVNIIKCKSQVLNIFLFIYIFHRLIILVLLSVSQKTHSHKHTAYMICWQFFFERCK